MAKDKINIARMALCDLELHKDKSSDKPQFGMPDLDHAHKLILDVLDYDEWTPRKKVINKTKLQRKQLKKYLKFLQEHDYVEERKNPREKREIQYRRIQFIVVNIVDPENIVFEGEIGELCHRLGGEEMTTTHRGFEITSCQVGQSGLNFDTVGMRRQNLVVKNGDSNTYIDVEYKDLFVDYIGR